MLYEPRATKTKILNAALTLVRTSGYEATSVDALCRAAGVTKGAFFHHFASKQDLAVTATHYWNEVTSGFFAAAPYHKLEDPLERLLGYIDFRAAMLQGRSLPESTCLLGTMAQEVYHSNPDIRAACLLGIISHADAVAEMIAAAKARHVPSALWSVESLALHTQVVIQGAFVLAKARNDLALATDSLQHLRRYVELLFQKTV
jgi:TetR/AcrR family transcriptional regulator, transcriptional repressor for nem operon